MRKKGGSFSANEVSQTSLQRSVKFSYPQFLNLSHSIHIISVIVGGTEISMIAFFGIRSINSIERIDLRPFDISAQSLSLRWMILHVGDGKFKQEAELEHWQVARGLR
jgi:hypothetical protein